MALVPSIVLKLVLVLLYPAALYVLRFYTRDELRKIRELLGKLPRPWRARA
jgi:hypothetical protein